jgi:hypothetical protein
MSDNYDYYILASVLTVLLLLMVIQTVYPYFHKKPLIESMHCDSSMGSNEFASSSTNEPSVFSSFPKEKGYDNGYNFGTPLVNSCLSKNANGQCDQEFNCLLTPHNERICYWNKQHSS